MAGRSGGGGQKYIHLYIFYKINNKNLMFDFYLWIVIADDK